VLARVRYFQWLDLELSPDSPRDSTLLVFAAGPADRPGEETFQATVCTPAALAELVARDGVVPGRHYIFVESLNTEQVENFVHDRLRRISGETWTELAEKIGRIGYWEFEDYEERPRRSGE
jgi:hypothetical protein